MLRNWDAIKSAEGGREPGLFGEVPENLPALLLARKLQRRAASSGFDVEDADAALAAAAAQVERLAHAPAASAGPQVADPERGELFAAVGDALFSLVSVARKLKVDPELALRASAARFRGERRGGRASLRRAPVRPGTSSIPTRSSPTTHKHD